MPLTLQDPLVSGRVVLLYFSAELDGSDLTAVLAETDAWNAANTTDKHVEYVVASRGRFSVYMRTDPKQPEQAEALTNEATQAVVDILRAAMGWKPAAK